MSGNRGSASLKCQRRNANPARAFERLVAKDPRNVRGHDHPCAMAETDR